MKKDKAIIYKRVSTDEQVGDGHYSLDTQERLCRTEIDKSNTYSLAADGIYADPGKSATSMNRPALKELLIRIEEDKSIGALYVQDTDRLSRNAKDHLIIRGLLKKHGVILVSVSQPGIEDSPEGNLMDLVLAGMNQFQSQITGRKTQKSMEERFRRGWLPTRAPMGYLNVGDPDNDKLRIIIIDPVRGPLIEEMFELYATGRYTDFQLTDLMFSKGLLNCSGRQLVRSRIAEILTCPFLYGEMQWKGQIATGNHPPLIPKELFLKCKAVRASHNGFRCRKRKYNFLLRGFLYCGCCGKRWTAEHQKLKTKSYYRCIRQSREIHCTEKYVEVTEMEKQIEAKFSAIEFSPSFIDKIVIKATALYRKGKSDHSEVKASLTVRKNSLLKSLEIAEEKVITGVFTDDAYARVKERVMPQIEAIDIEIGKLDKTKTLKVDVIQKLLDLIRHLGSSYKQATPELKRVYLGLFWKKFVVSSGKVQEAILADVIEELISLGQAMLKQENKPFERVFRDRKAYLTENIKIRMERVLSLGIEPRLTA